MWYLTRILKIGSLVRIPNCWFNFRGQLTFFTGLIRSSTSKDDDDDVPFKKPKDTKTPAGYGSKEEIGPAPTPGFVRPDNLCDEGLFTQKARQQIEEQKKKQAKPSLTNPEHGT